MAQVETKQAVDRVEELCRVPGLDAIFIGPAVEEARTALRK
jgi:2-keto-3-deoxy-L-rhamnonate aldolase RhmA